jgi:hypothetical protein
MRNFRHLHLLCFASSAEIPQPYGFHITVLSTNLLFAPSKPWQAHYEEDCVLNAR